MAVPERPAPRWSRLAWVTFACGVIPTVAGQLLAPVLAVITWLELRAARGRERGGWLAALGVAAAAGWLVGAGWVVQREWDVYEREQAAIAESDVDCRARMLELAEAWAQATDVDPTVVDLDPATVLPWLVTQGYCEAHVLHCPLEAAEGGPGSYRFLPPLPPHVLAPENCVVLYEAHPRHRRNGRRGRNVVFHDGRAVFLENARFREVLQRQETVRAASR